VDHAQMHCEDETWIELERTAVSVSRMILRGP